MATKNKVKKSSVDELNEINRIQNLFQAYDRGIVSKRAICDVLKRDYDKEMEYIKQEKITEAVCNEKEV